MDGEREQVRCGAKLPHDPHGWPGMFGGQSLLCDGGYRLCGASTIAAVTHPGHFWGDRARRSALVRGVGGKGGVAPDLHLRWHPCYNGTVPGHGSPGTVSERTPQ